MKCFYHTDIDSVGQCQVCGKGLCKECFIKYNGVCTDCVYGAAKEEVEEEHVDVLMYLEDYKKKLTSCLVWGTIFAVIILVIIIANGVFSTGIANILIGLYGCCAFYGIFAFTKKVNKDPNRYMKNMTALVGLGSYNDVVSGMAAGYFIGKLLGFMYKVMFGSLLGFFCLLYLIIKLNKTNKNIELVKESYCTEMNDLDNAKIADEQ